MRGFIIEKSIGKVDLNKNNILIKDLEDMHELEYWEHRLENELKVPFVIAFRKIDGKIKYSIFTDIRGKGSVFK